MSEITVTEVQVVPINARDGLVGIASVVFNNSLHLGAIGIFTRPEGGFRLTYPTRKAGNKNMNVFYPIRKEVAVILENVIISKFENVIKMYAGHDETDA